jgi:hypothetical protein
MEITRRVLGSSAIVSQDPGERDIRVALDLGGFVRRLLLFDTYVLYSVRLKEVPELVRHFGVQGTLDLLSSGALEIRCECAQFMEGQFNTPECPPLVFQFHVIDAHVWEQYLIDGLSELRKALTLSGRELMSLESAVVKAVKRSDNRQMFTTEIAPAFESELLHNERLVRASVLFVLWKHHALRDCDFNLKIHKVGEDRYQAETNLLEKVRLSRADIHNTIRLALLGISGLTQRIGEMKAHVALSGFTEQELPLFRTKFDSLADAMGSERQEGRLQRVISISGLSDIAPDQRIDMEKLLQIRSEPEALEFRGWLACVDKLSDSEVTERVASLNAKLGLAVQSATGKALRLLVTTLAGVVSLPSGVALSILDQFMWDKFFSRSGVAAFVNDLYPSIFKTNEDKRKPASSRG